MKYDIIELNDRKFDVKRVIPSDMATDRMSVAIKQLWGCDVVLRKGGNHYFVAEIEDAEWENVVKSHTLLAISDEKPYTNG